jgi:acyl-CoA thioesterase II
VTENIAGFLELLDLERIEDNVFRGRTMAGIPRTRVFGGHVAAQALVAGGRTVSHGRVHSLHAYFLRPGDPQVPILYEVDRIHEGRSFSRRRVVALQHGEAIFTSACSFHEDEESVTHADVMPDVPGPDAIAPLEAVGSGRTGRVPLNFLDGSGLDVRYLGGPPWARELDAPPTGERMWLRTKGALPDETILHAAALTYASDLSLVGTILRRHQGVWANPNFRAASLDHSVWFHRPFRADEWLFYDQVSPIAFGARGLAQGRLFTEQGTLVASVAQEGLVRIARPQ